MSTGSSNHNTELLWSKFCSSLDKTDFTTEDALRVVKTVSTLAFGQDPVVKRTIIDGGALELVVQALNTYNSIMLSYDSSSNNSSTLTNILELGLKGIRSCVIRNPHGRTRCRNAKVLPCLDHILSRIISTETKYNADNSDDSNKFLLIENILTTVAAICLGDDMNALQAAIGTMSISNYIIHNQYYNPINNMKHQTATAFSSNNDVSNMSKSDSSLQQKVIYLHTLFSTVLSEQGIKIDSSNNNIGTNVPNPIVENYVLAEEAKKRGNDYYAKCSYTVAEEEYSTAIKLISFPINSNNIEVTTNYDDNNGSSRILPCMKEIAGTLYSNRSACLYELGRYEEALADAELVLEYRTGWIKGYFRVSQALAKLGRVHEARETLGKGLIIEPGNEDLKNELQKLIP